MTPTQGNIFRIELRSRNLKWVPNLSFHYPSSTPTPNKDSSRNPASSSSSSISTSIPGNDDNQNDSKAGSLQLDGNKEHDPFITMFPPRPVAEGEKFLAYLPHSGLHNQLISLENALRLAAHLNRTLLLPPLYLSHKRNTIPWKEPPILLDSWAERNKTGLEYCRDIDPSTWPPKTKEQRQAMTEEEKKTERECLLYHAWTITPWTYFYNIPKILTGVVGVGGQEEPIRVFNRPVMSLEWLEEHLDIKDPSTEVYFFNDTSRYAYRIMDDSETDYGVMPEIDEEDMTRSMKYALRYESSLFLTDLQRRPEKVLHFGSLFAADRVEARSEKHQALQLYISREMNLWNQAIVDATNSAEKQMEEWSIQTKRAAPDFLGVHFRTEDGGFEKLAPKNLRRIAAWLGEMEKQDLKYVNRTEGSETTTVPESSPDQDPSTVTTEVQEVVPTFLERCMGSPPESPMIFMATDVHKPRHAPLLHEFLDQYPCTMFLSDFPEAVEILDQIHNTADG
ncbi:hypothetical protein BGX20_003087, partial [Mortierella sp. AD010]